MDELVDITVTASNPDELADLTRTLVEEGLVACGNIIPGVRSIYTWEGAIEDDAEALVVLHTRRDLVQQVIDRITEEHPYEAPQILALPVVDAHPGYEKWLRDATAADVS